ncbi:MAG: hypothetical protein ACREJB_07150, partial [Planctomycetaceae bacterium]
AMVVGLHAIAKSVTQELNDFSNAIGALDQTFEFQGLRKSKHARVVGSAFRDRQDQCDCAIIKQERPVPHVDRSSSVAEKD